MQSSGLRFGLAAAVFACAMSQSATAQEVREPAGGALPDYAKVFTVRDDDGMRADVSTARNGLPNVVVTGYWPPTNEMLRRFSANSDQNPWGWIGQNWEWRGYNIYSFFPEFPEGLGKGEGDFEVDYQDTSADWWSIIAGIRPIAIITFGRAEYDYDWELEGGHHMYPLDEWGYDYLAPYQPTPELPIGQETPGTDRWSSLPMQAIVDALTASVPGVDPYFTTIDDSNFLCNFIGYHATWYHDEHSEPEDPNRNVAAGHIHVGYRMSLLDAVLATEVTLQTLTGHLDAELLVPMDFEPDGDVDGDDQAVFESCFGQSTEPPCDLADSDGDYDVDCADWEIFKRTWTESLDDLDLFVDCDLDCNGNLVADEFDIALGTSRDCNANLIPDGCDVTQGTSDDLNGNGIPDECDARTPLAEDSLGISCTGDSDCWSSGENESYCVVPPGGSDPGRCYAPKTRYLSIAAHPEQAFSTARRIKLDGGRGWTRWIGAPQWVEPLGQRDGFWLSDVVSSPVYMGEWPSVVQVSACRIAPGYTYLVQAIVQWQDLGDEDSYSEALALRTNSTWGDTVSTCAGNECKPPDGYASLDDIMASISYFQGTFVAPLTWLDIDPSGGSATPDWIVGLGDIMACIAGFQSEGYPGDGPLNCP